MRNLDTARRVNLNNPLTRDQVAAAIPVCYLSIVWKQCDAAEFFGDDCMLDTVDYLNKYYGHAYKFEAKHTPIPHLSSLHVIAVSDLQGRHVGYFESEAE